MKKIALVMILMLSGCSGSDHRVNETVSSSMDRMADAGIIPRLDRSDSIAGPDKDANGIRDDVDTWIAARATERKYTPAQVAATKQMAMAYQKALLTNISDKKALKLTANENIDAVFCLSDTFGCNENGRVDIRSVTLNTKSRVIAFYKYDQALDGSAWMGVDGNSCK